MLLYMNKKSGLFKHGMFCACRRNRQDRLLQKGMRDISFTQLEERILSDDFLYIMLKEGFGWYLQRMRELGCAVPELVSFPCECCALVFNNDSFLDQIRGDVKCRAQALRLAEQQQNNEV